MLILTRAPGEKLYIGRAITITVLGRRGDVIRLGIEAPESERVSRHEFGLTSHLAAQAEREQEGGADEVSTAAGRARNPVK